MRRGQLMAGSLLLMGLPLLALIVNNIYYFFLEPTVEFAWFLVSDLLSLLILFALWVYNRKGGTRWVGIVTVVMASFGISFMYSPDNPSNGLLMYALPILIASFVIEPNASFGVYLISLITYTISLNQANLIDYYDVTGMTALLVISIATWIISDRLENTISHNTALYNDLQLSNQELKDSYETTLEGWSRALDLRDKDTEGHTQRVTELTLQIARAMGFTPEQLVHVRRGALLHDIGKMGVPDVILHKPGLLSEEEWHLMRRHPELAFELLSPIQYLEPALDIPHYHHEKWDGTGYPEKLKGEQIPLAARIFAVVDVYDALTSDRPYRSAWPKENALEYIRLQSGTHFDPAVVDVFLKELGS
jgi:putative nucleotidyltransferase with HDIG domain